MKFNKLNEMTIELEYKSKLYKVEKMCNGTTRSIVFDLIEDKEIHNSIYPRYVANFQDELNSLFDQFSIDKEE